MSDNHTIGLLGFGRIGRWLSDRIRADPAFELEYALVRSETPALPAETQVTEPARLADRPVDLCVEVATPEVLAEVGPTVLEASDLAALSGSALADPAVSERITSAAAANGTDVILPHAALLGIDGLVDAREELTDVTIETTKHPSDVDFGFTDAVDAADVDGPTEVFEGPVRELCRALPRSFNSHAVVALASLGLDDTRSTLIADPEAERSTHVIRASGEQFSLAVERESAIGDVDGNYTHVTVWGSIRRVLDATGEPFTFV
jgi:aspartate dehydrogenase